MGMEKNSARRCRTEAALRHRSRLMTRGRELHRMTRTIALVSSSITAQLYLFLRSARFSICVTHRLLSCRNKPTAVISQTPRRRHRSQTPRLRHRSQPPRRRRRSGHQDVGHQHVTITTAMTGHRNDEINADGEDYDEVDDEIGAKVGGDCGERLQATHVRLLCSILYFFTVLFPHA
jgi:hypothetical protein